MSIYYIIYEEGLVVGSQLLTIDGMKRLEAEGFRLIKEEQL